MNIYLLEYLPSTRVEIDSMILCIVLVPFQAYNIGVLVQLEDPFFDPRHAL